MVEVWHKCGQCTGNVWEIKYGHFFSFLSLTLKAWQQWTGNVIILVAPFSYIFAFNSKFYSTLFTLYFQKNGKQNKTKRIIKMLEISSLRPSVPTWTLDPPSPVRADSWKTHHFQKFEKNTNLLKYQHYKYSIYLISPMHFRHFRHL